MRVQTANVVRLDERDTVMPQSHSVRNHVYPSEVSDLMRFSAWLLACALLLEGNCQQPRQRQAHKGRMEYVA